MPTKTSVHLTSDLKGNVIKLRDFDTLHFASPSPSGEGFRVRSELRGEYAQVYNAQGALVRTAAIGCGDFQIADIPTGIYIVKIGSAAEKVMVR